MDARDNQNMIHALQNGKPDVHNRSYPISVRFASPEQFEIPLKTMNVAHPLLEQMPGLSLFEIAGRVESPVEFFNNRYCRQPMDSTSHFSQTSESIQTTMTKTNIPAKRTSAGTKKRSTKTESIASETTNAPKKSAAATSATRHTEFRFQAPAARSVKLVADFTEWEKSPVDMTRDERGLWETSVSLTPGEYAYRFIVDGEWSEDPQAFQSVVNPYGTVNSVIRVS